MLIISAHVKHKRPQPTIQKNKKYTKAKRVREMEKQLKPWRLLMSNEASESHHPKKRKKNTINIEEYSTSTITQKMRKKKTRRKRDQRERR